MLKQLEALKGEVFAKPEHGEGIAETLYAEGMAAHFDEKPVITRAYGLENMLIEGKKHIYGNDLIAGSIRGKFAEAVSPARKARAERIYKSYGMRSFLTNADHYAPDYATFLRDGIGGTIVKIRASAAEHEKDSDREEKLGFLRAAEISMRAFGRMIGGYAQAAEEAAENCASENGRSLREMACILRKLTWEKPDTFREALQLMWLTHIAFVWEGRYAMAFGRMDQFLYPYYRADVDAGRMTREEALLLLSCTLIKIADVGRNDVCNIAIGGMLRDGSGGVNELSYLLLEAVGECGIPGPNLSARIYRDAPDEFLDACLQLIGTGIGYPAMMNDEVNIPALARHGYEIEDCRDYTMVGCIENFITGKQPPWSDGRYNSPKFIELALNDGRCLQTGIQMGPRTGSAASIDCMEEFMVRLRRQMEAGAAEYMALFLNENDRYNRKRYAQPFLSCFCRDCIGRAKDINDGGAVYPSVHGAGCMGISTVADSLAAIEKVVFEEKKATISELRDALEADFAGYEKLHKALLDAPKYGNNDDFVDKYAVWYVEEHERLFSKYRTPDGGAIYTAIASNVNNIPAGREVAATPDGRRCGEPVSDAASPMRGMDKEGPTAVVLSVSKPDYTLVSCGTVLNQKYSPSMFEDREKRSRLAALVRVYFERGGQEIQINSVSRDVLMDAMEKPDQYRSLVVRVSGFSAYYTTLDRAVQKDILLRTEQE